MSERKLTVLGTGSQAPTRNRNHGGYLLRWDSHGFLFDPGEGVQRQMIHAGVSAPEITKIFITHFHGDHCLGLAGIVQRLSLDRVEHTVEVYYPASGQRFFENLKNSSIYHNTLKIKTCPVSSPGIIFEDDKITIETKKLSHPVDTWGYCLHEKDSQTMIPALLKEKGITGQDISRLKSEGSLKIGKKTILLDDVSVPRKGQRFAFVMDTRLCESACDLAKEADMLVIESTYLSDRTAQAEEFGHMTAAQAAKLAADAGAHLLVLSHFSQIYQSSRDFFLEASEYHPNVIAANDGQCIPLPKRNRKLEK